MTKITPELEKFIADNHLMTCRALVALIEDKFKIKVTFKTVNNYLDIARAENASKNNAKVEAVRSAVLEDAGRYAEKYLKILDKDIDAWDAFLTSGILVFPKREGETEARQITIDGAKDRSSASQSLQKCIGMVLDFAKPPEKGNNNNINVNLSVYTEEELEDYGRLAAKLAGVQEGKGKTASS